MECWLYAGGASRVWFTRWVLGIEYFTYTQTCIRFQLPSRIMLMIVENVSLPIDHLFGVFAASMLQQWWPTFLAASLRLAATYLNLNRHSYWWHEFGGAAPVVGCLCCSGCFDAARNACLWECSTRAANFEVEILFVISFFFSKNLRIFSYFFSVPFYWRIFCGISLKKRKFLALSLIWPRQRPS